MKAFEALNPREVLSLAIAIEARNAEQYKEWADRFEPFDFETSIILENLADEEKRHEKELKDLFSRQFGTAPVKIDPDEAGQRIEKPSFPDEHFFVVDCGMAGRILQAALRTELKARTFYERLSERTKDPPLLKVYGALAVFEEDHVQALQNRLTRLKIGSHRTSAGEKTVPNQ